MGIAEWRVDLHTHTKHSDGKDTPSELVLQAKALNLKGIAITDHDNIDALTEGVEAGLREGVEVIPGVEISTQHKDLYDIHLLGYYVAWTDSHLIQVLEDFQQRRIQRGKQVLEKVNSKLRTEGRDIIAYEAILERVAGSFGRPHIAEQLLEKGYVKNMDEAFQKYLIPCNVHRTMLPLTQAIRLLRQVKGIPVLAHPTLITKDRPRLRKLLKEIQAAGLLGLEAYHNDHDTTEIPYFRKLAREFSLIYTGGSDYHSRDQGSQLGSGRGNLSVPYSTLINLKKCYLATYPFVIMLKGLAEERNKLFREVLSRYYGVSLVTSSSDVRILTEAPPHSLLLDISLASPAQQEQWYQAALQQKKQIAIFTEDSSWSSFGGLRIVWPLDTNFDPSYIPHFLLHQVILASLNGNSS